MDQKSSLESAKEKLIQLYGTGSCKKLINISSSEAAFSALRRNIEREFSKYKDKLPEAQYQQFIEEIFVAFKEYKLCLQSVDQESYGKIYGDFAVEIMGIKGKYGV